MPIRQDQEFHNKTCNLVARVRIPYPNNERPEWRTITNHPKQMVTFNNGKLIPDVVVLDKENKAMVLGEIETEDTINAESAKQWLDYSGICELLYVYVPVGYGQAAKELEIVGSVTGFREFSYNDEGITINNI